jgi:hypothetical protein
MRFMAVPLKMQPSSVGKKYNYTIARSICARIVIVWLVREEEVHDLLPIMLSDFVLVLKDKRLLWKGKVLTTNRNSQSDKGYHVWDVTKGR